MHICLDKGKKLEILYIERIGSTHKYLIEEFKKGNIKPNTALYARVQYDGIGSRGNNWEGCEGNLYLSICIHKDKFPQDLPPASISIYCASLFKEELSLLGSKVWLKWPNDFYIKKRKIGGLITAKIQDAYIVSTGLNILSCPQEFGILDIKLTPFEITQIFTSTFEKKTSWKKVFSKFKVEFQNSKDFTFHDGDTTLPMKDAVLCEDGSIKIEDKKVYSLR